MGKNFFLFFFILSFSGYAQKETNYDESKVPKYKLPEVLVSDKGEKIVDSKAWIEKRRPEILSLFEENIYGKIPVKLEGSFKVIDNSDQGLNGKAVRKQVVMTYRNNGKEINLNLLIFLPKSSQKVPVVIGLNFWGNQTLAEDTAIVISKGTRRARGVGKIMLPAERLIDAGYGLATIYMGDIDPDKQGEPDFSDGVHPLLYKENQTRPLDNEWGAIAAWSWGLCKAMDYFETDKDIDSKRVAVFGHSRLGKAALWAGATDERFALVISNNSGCGGAALSRRQFGERLGGMNNQFKQWLCQNSRKYDWNEDALPVDQHELIALIAPRPVYVASAEEDLWADPKGEFLSAYYASPVYELFGKKGLDSDQMPEINKPVMTTIGYHIRTGKHGALAYDWDQYIKFADMHLKKK